MSGVNKVILVGNMGADPELRYLPDGTCMAKVNLATSDVRRDKDQQRVEHTEWHRLAFFGRQAEVAGQYLHKGSKIYVEGSLRTRKWEAKDGSPRYTTEIRVLQFQMLDSRGGGGRRDSDDGYGQDSYRQPKPKQQPPAEEAKEKGAFDELDEDIPF